MRLSSAGLETQAMPGVAAGASNFREDQLLAHERAPGAQRPQHPEQQAVNMLGGDAADHQALPSRRPRAVQCFDFIGQFAQVSVRCVGLAAGTEVGRRSGQPIQVQGRGAERRVAKSLRGASSA